MKRSFAFIRVAALFGITISSAALCENASAQTPPTTAPQPRFNVPRGPRSGSLYTRPDEFFTSEEGKRLLNNILSWQNENGGWYKNYSVGEPRPAVLVDDPNSGPPGDDDSVWHKVSTIDNNATYSEIRVLARAYRVTSDPRYKAAFDKALKYLFDAQYPNGGWPQRFPLQDNYGRHITYNDGGMINVMHVMRDIAEKKPDFAFATDAERKQAQAAFDRGVDCILKSQYKKDGKLTVWGQQVDEVTLAPTGARTYELPSLCGSESAGILTFLMALPNPDQRIKDAIEGGHTWFQESIVVGKRMGNGPSGRTLIDDPNAPPLWGRFYDLKTNKPFVSGRDGIPKEKLEDIPAERRNGYSWFGGYGTPVIEGYKTWKAQFAAK